MINERERFHPVNQENKETKKLKDIFLNKWTVLLTAIASCAVLYLNLGEKDRVEKIDKFKNELKLDEKDLPDNPKEVQEAIEAINNLHNLLRERGYASHLNEGKGEEEQKPDEACITGEDRVVRDTSEQMIVEKPICANGHQVAGEYKFYDKTLPDDETATDEISNLLSDYFEKNLPDLKIKRKNPWEYDVSENSKNNEKWEEFNVDIRVEKDGTYRVGHITNFDDYAYAEDLQSLEQIIRDKFEAFQLYLEWDTPKVNGGEDAEEFFFSFMKEKGFTPTEDIEKVDAILKKLKENKNK